MNIKVKEHAFKVLEEMKKKHSKVQNIHHKKLRMQPYFMPTKSNISEEDIQWIFRIRCREIKVKMNYQGLYDTFECKICLEEVENQEHVYKCKEIWKLRKMEKQPITNYEKIINGDVEDQIKISRIIRENMKIIDR